MWLGGTDSSDGQFALLSQPNEGNPNPLDSRKRILSRKRGFSRRKHIDLRTFSSFEVDVQSTLCTVRLAFMPLETARRL